MNLACPCKSVTAAESASHGFQVESPSANPETPYKKQEMRGLSLESWIKMDSSSRRVDGDASTEFFRV